MNKQILILLIFVPTMLFAQKTQKVTDKKTKETFYVLKSDKKTRHGEYKKFGYNKLIIKGSYKLGVKEGIWECYDYNGQLTLKYDYTKNELVFYKINDRVKDKKYRVIENGNKIDTTLSRPPIFLGDDYFIISELNYPTIAQEHGKSGKVVVLFDIDKFGKTSNYRVEIPIGYGMDEEAVRVIKLTQDDWLPGLLNGQPVDVEFDYPLTFRIND